MGRFLTKFIINALVVLGLVLTASGCGTTCDCPSEISAFGVEVIQSNATYFKWEKQFGVPSYVITITNDVGQSVEYSFKLASSDSPKKGITYDGFFKQGGGTYKAILLCKCTASPDCKEDSPKSNEITFTP